MLTVSKREGSPYWQITGTVCGVRVRESSRTTVIKDAQKLASEIQEKIFNETHGEKTFAHAVEAYLDQGGSKLYLKKIVTAIGKYPLSDINQALIDKYSRIAYGSYKKGENGKVRKYSNSTIKRQWYTPISTVMHYAAEIGMCDYKRYKSPTPKRPPPDWADKEWFDKFLTHADTDLRSIVIFLMGTGCRISEALNLKPEDIRGNVAYVKTTKNGEPREAHLPEFVRTAIKDHLTGERVFDMFKSRHNVNNALKRTCKKAGIRYLSSHQVGSHTFATNLAKKGLDARALTETGRWKDPKSTHHYTHYLKREVAEKADELEDLIK